MKRTNAFVVIVLLGVVSVSVGQHHSHGERKPPATDKVVLNSRPPTPGRVELPLKSFELPDSSLIDQNGKRVRFYSDLVKGKVVVINFFFTKCNDVCPMQGRSIARLKNRLGDRVGREVFFISVSKDPQNDTVERLTKWGKDYDVSSGWTLVTGAEAVIKKLLLDFNGEQIGQGMHESVLLIGNDKTGVWTSSDGLLFPEDIVKVIDAVSRAK
jgi:cytochrome oxidase Cu insertion factor (SCO1/SenC/PrrC family)